MTSAKIEETLVKFTKNMLYVAMMVFVVIAAISKMGVETTSFAAVIAAAGLAIDLSLQGTLSNFSAGVLLIIFRPFKVGDFVDAGGISGIVEEIRIFSTQMRSGDNYADTGGILHFLGFITHRRWRLPSNDEWVNFVSTPLLYVELIFFYLVIHFTQVAPRRGPGSLLQGVCRHGG